MVSVLSVHVCPLLYYKGLDTQGESTMINHPTKQCSTERIVSLSSMSLLSFRKGVEQG